MVRRMKSRKRMRKKLQEIKQQLRQRMHDSVSKTGDWLRAALLGFNCYTVPRNVDNPSGEPSDNRYVDHLIYPFLLRWFSLGRTGNMLIYPKGHYQFISCDASSSG
jgi:hypothetical protein